MVKIHKLSDIARQLKVPQSIVLKVAKELYLEGNLQGILDSEHNIFLAVSPKEANKLGKKLTCSKTSIDELSKEIAIPIREINLLIAWLKEKGHTEGCYTIHRKFFLGKEAILNYIRDILRTNKSIPFQELAEDLNLKEEAIAHFMEETQVENGLIYKEKIISMHLLREKIIQNMNKHEYKSLSLTRLSETSRIDLELIEIVLNHPVLQDSLGRWRFNPQLEVLVSFPVINWMHTFESIRIIEKGDMGFWDFGERKTCCVCSLLIEPYDETARCPYCEAIGHTNHFKEWLHSRGICPLCRRKLDEKELLA